EPLGVGTFMSCSSFISRETVACVTLKLYSFNFSTRSSCVSTFPFVMISLIFICLIDLFDMGCPPRFSFYIYSYNILKLMNITQKRALSRKQPAECLPHQWICLDDVRYSDAVNIQYCLYRLLSVNVPGPEV